VADTFNHRVVVFGLDGTFLRMWSSQGSGRGQFRYPFAVGVLPLGQVIITDGEITGYRCLMGRALSFRAWDRTAVDKRSFRLHAASRFQPRERSLCVSMMGIAFKCFANHTIHWD